MPAPLLTDTLPSNFTWEMIHVRSGRSLMGSDEYGEILRWKGPIHKVTVNDFYIGKYPFTHMQIALMEFAYFQKQ